MRRQARLFSFRLVCCAIAQVCSSHHGCWWWCKIVHGCYCWFIMSCNYFLALWCVMSWCLYTVGYWFYFMSWAWDYRLWSCVIHVLHAYAVWCSFMHVMQIIAARFSSCCVTRIKYDAWAVWWIICVWCRCCMHMCACVRCISTPNYLKMTPFHISFGLVAAGFRIHLDLGLSFSDWISQFPS